MYWYLKFCTVLWMGDHVENHSVFAHRPVANNNTVNAEGY